MSGVGVVVEKADGREPSDADDVYKKVQPRVPSVPCVKTVSYLLQYVIANSHRPGSPVPAALPGGRPFIALPTRRTKHETSNRFHA